MTDTLDTELARMGEPDKSRAYLRAHPEAIPESLDFDGEVMSRVKPMWVNQTDEE